MYSHPYTKKHEQLEEYFAEKYTEKYIELGGYFYIKPVWPFGKSPMEKYFQSGQYLELNDRQLEKLWEPVKREILYKKVIIIVAVIFFLVTLAAKGTR